MCTLTADILTVTYKDFFSFSLKLVSLGGGLNALSLSECFPVCIAADTLLCDSSNRYICTLFQGRLSPLTPMTQTPPPLPFSPPSPLPPSPLLFPPYFPSPIPLFPFPSLLFPILSLSPAVKQPPEIGKGSGGCFSSHSGVRGGVPSGVPGGAPAANAFWVNLEPKKLI